MGGSANTAVGWPAGTKRGFPELWSVPPEHYCALVANSWDFEVTGWPLS